MRISLNIFKEAPLWVFLLYLLLANLSLLFGDRGYYDSDSVAILAGSINLAHAKAGDFFLYDYYIQPLTYELNYLFFKVSHRAYLLYYLPALFGALGICFLVIGSHLFSEKKINIISGFFILLFFPELFFRLLYPNSSVFGMTFFALAVSFLFWESSKRRDKVSSNLDYIFIGIFSALACLFRFDFLLGLPLLAYLVKAKSNGWRNLFFYIFGIMLTFAIGFLAGIFNPLEIIKLHAFHAEIIKHALEWNYKQSIGVLFSAANIFAWFILMLYLLARIIKAARAKEWRFFLILPFIALLFYSFLSGLSNTHYLIAAICFAPFALTGAIVDFSKSRFAHKLRLSLSKIIFPIIILSICVQFISFEIHFQAPWRFYFHIAQNQAYLMSADGETRAMGAYLKGYLSVLRANMSSLIISPLSLAHTMADIISDDESDYLIICAKHLPGNYLSSLALYSVPFFLQIKGYQIQYGKDKLVFVGKHNQALIRFLGQSEYDDFDRSDIPKAVKFIKIPMIRRQQPQTSSQLIKFYEELLKL